MGTCLTRHADGADSLLHLLHAARMLGQAGEAILLHHPRCWLFFTCKGRAELAGCPRHALCLISSRHSGCELLMI